MKSALHEKAGFLDDVKIDDQFTCKKPSMF